jgi:hypothetical protein
VRREEGGVMRHKSIFVFLSLNRVANGPKFWPHNPKATVKKSGGPEKLAAKFVSDSQKRAKKGPNFFQTFVLGIICGSSEVNAFLSQLYLDIIFEVFSFFFDPGTSFQVGPKFFVKI